MRGRDDDEFLRPGHLDEAFEDDVPERNVEQPEPHYDQPHHRAAAECDLQAAVERLARGVGRTRRSVGRGLHAEIAGKSRKESARQEGEGHPRVLHPGAVGQIGEKQRQHHEYDRDDLVLLAQVGHGALAHVPAISRMRGVPSSSRFIAAVKRPSSAQGDNRGSGNDPENGRNVHFDRISLVFKVINTNIIIYPDTVLSGRPIYSTKIPAAPHSPPALRQRKTERSEAFETLRIFALPFMRLRRSADHRTATSRSCRRGYSPTALRGRPAS